MRNRSIMLKILSTVNTQTAPFLELPSSMAIPCFCSGYDSSEERKLCGFVFLFFTPKVFLIVQLGGLNISNKPVFWGFYIAVDNL